MEDIRRSKGKMKGENQRGRRTMRNYGLWETEGFRGERVGGWASPVMGIKDGTYCMEHWVLYGNNESWNNTSEAGDVLYGD